MSEPSVNTPIFIVEGCTIGRLAVGQLVFNVREHPLFVQTPISYIRQGRLRECTCACGNKKLVAEKILERGQVLSCGCLKRERSIIAAQKRINNQTTSEERKKLTDEIRSEQNRLKYQLTQYPVNDELVTQISTRIKELMLKKMKTVDYKQNARMRRYRREKKLLEGLEFGTDQDSHGEAQQTTPGET